MFNDFRNSRTGVVSRVLGISAFIAILFVAGCTTTKSITVGPPARLAFMAQPGNVGAAASISPVVTVSIEDANGHLVTTATNQVTIAIGTNPSAGTLSGTATVTAVAGVATFSNLSINNVGTGYTLMASATGLTSATSSAFSVVGPPTKLAFTVQPSNVAAGSSISPAATVSIEDAAGNVVPTATNQISLVIGTNPSSGTLSGTAQASAVAGVATFSNLSINKAGIGYTLAASATSLTGATSSAFNVTPGAAAKLVFTAQPTNTTAGMAISPAVQVTIEDSLGNVVTTATNTVTMGIGAGGGTLIGTTAVAAVSGVATFSNLNINLAGTGYTLSASATSLTGATSGAFNVTVGAAAKLVFTGEPSNVAAGSSINPAVVVSIEDAVGNVVPTATNQVTVAIQNNPSSGTLSGTAQVTAVAGVATFSNLSINKLGTGYTLNNSAAGLAGTNSTAFNVTAGAPAKLVFTTQPTNATAGAAISPAVQVAIEDNQSNVVTTATNLVTLTIAMNPSGAPLGGTTSVAAVAGVATFSNLSINTTGTGYTLAAAAGALTGPNSTAFNILAGTAAKLAFTTQPLSSETAGSGFVVAVGIEDTFGNVVNSSATVTLGIGSGSPAGTLGGTTSASATSGIATFPGLSISLAGANYTLTASASSLGGATSNPFTIVPAAAAKLAFTSQPLNTVVNTDITPGVAVSIEDTFGNVVNSSASVTLAIGSNPSSGTLGGTVTVAASSGVATFSNLTINATGNGYTLTATSGALTAATSGSFNILVSIGPPAKLAFTVEPTNVTAGVSISPAVKVSVQDSNGNTVPTATNSITVSFGITPPAGATLGGTLTASAVNGVATFSNLNINVASTGYSLQAAATGLTSASSTTFNVTAGAPTKLAFTVQPSNVVSQVAMSPGAAVSVEDSFGNVVTTATNQITVAIQNNPSSGTLGGTTAVTAVNGVSTFSNLTVNKAGTGYTLTASSSPLTSAGSTSFNVTAGAATQLAYLVQPSNVAANSSISPAVQVAFEDAQGNVVTSDTNSITIGLFTDPTSATLGGTLTKSAVAGVATFSDLNVNTVGTGYQLGAIFGAFTTAVSNTFNVTSSSCTTNCTLSGTVSGPWVQGITLTLSVGPTAGSTTTDANGNYSFTGLAGGTYTVTPSLAGYTYSPTSLSTAVNATGQNFTATPVLASYSISGTVSYSGTYSGTGVTMIRVYPNGCTGCGAIAGTTIASHSGAFTVRGLAPSGGGGINNNSNGNYTVVAEIDEQGTGATNASNAASSAVTAPQITTANVSVGTVTMVDRTPPTPASVLGTGGYSAPSVFPTTGAVFVSYNDLGDNFGEEVATTYTLSYGTDTNASNVGTKTIPAGNGNNVYLLSGLSTTSAYYFKISANNSSGSTTSAVTATAVTPVAPTGGSTLSGTVTTTGVTIPTTGAVMYVGFFSGTHGVFFQRIMNPSTSQSFMVTGVPAAGVYNLFAVIDMNGNGSIDLGDITNFTGQNGPPPFQVTGTQSGIAISLTGAAAVSTVVTSTSSFNGGANSYGVSVNTNTGAKRPTAITLFSAPAAGVPFDMEFDSHGNGNFNPVINPAVSPNVGDTYKFLVSFSDASTPQVITAKVTSGPTTFARSLAMNTNTPYSGTAPQLTWLAPSTPPSQTPYSYSVGVYDPNNNGSGVNWNYSGGHNGNGIPSTTTNVPFNTDGSASNLVNGGLAPGTLYDWYVTVQDAVGNSAQYTTTYTTPGSAGPTPPSISSYFTVPTIPAGGITQLNFNLSNPNSSSTLSNISFNDALTNGLQMTGNVAYNTCPFTPGGVTSGSTLLTVSGLTLSSGSSCTFAVTITGVTANTGTINITTTAITATESGAGSTSTATISVLTSAVVGPSVNPFYSPSTINAGQTTTLNFNVYDTNGSTSLTGIGFTYTLASGISFTGTPSDNGCGGSAVITNPTLFTFSGGSLTAGGSCTLSVTVSGNSAGTYSAQASGITSAQAAGSTNYPAILTVNAGAAPGISSGTSTTFTVGVNGNFTVQGTGNPLPSLSESGALPTNVTFVDNGNGTATLSGAPAAGSATSYPINITAHNGVGTDATQSFTLKVVTDPCQTIVGGNEALLTGHYAFLLKGFDNGTTGSETSPEPALVGGVLTFNGTNNNGLITAGTLDMNLNGTAGVSSQSVTGGTYKINSASDHRGCMAITTAGGTQHYRFSLGNIVGGVASTGHMIDFDSTGPFTAGELLKQSSTIPTTLSGSFAFGVSSIQNTASTNGNGGLGGSFGAAGTMTLASNNTLTPGGNVDYNQNGFLDNGSTVGGSWPSSTSFASGHYTISANGRGTFTFTPSGQQALNTVIYVVSSSEFLILESDPQASNSIFAGPALLQSTTSFSANPLSGNYVGYQSGLGSTAGKSRITLILLNASGTGITGNQIRNDGGSFQSKSLTGITYTVAASGRMTITGGGGSNTPLFYLVNSSQAFFLSSDPGVDMGIFQSQSGSPFTNTSASGTYAFGSIDPQDPSLSDNSGVASFTSPNANVTEDDNSNGSQNADQVQSFPYSIDSTGLGTIPNTGSTCTISSNSTTCGTVFYVISPTKAVILDTGTSNPKAQLADK